MPETPAVQQNGLTVRRVWQAFLVLLFAMWWGGLTFYAIFVVPVGTQQIGSVGQGFITQKVTLAHNVLLIAMTICLLIEARIQRSRWLGIVAAGLLLTGAGLFLQHAHLTTLMDFSQQTVPGHFYTQHAVYLWLTAVEWGLGFAVSAALRPQF